MNTEYTHEDYNNARICGNYASAAKIARSLARKNDGTDDPKWIAAAERMESLIEE